MKCIFCRCNEIGPPEHVFPESIGGCFSISALCIACNNRLGTRADKWLVDHSVMLLNRIRHNIPNKKGRVPDFFSDFLGDGELVEFPGHSGRGILDRGAKRATVKIFLKPSTTISPNGDQISKYLVQKDSICEFQKVIQRNRRRLGRPPLSQVELENEISRVQQEQPCYGDVTLRHSFEVGTAPLLPGICKIAYEMAYTWLGKEWLNENNASRIRDLALQEHLSGEGLDFVTIVAASACPELSGWVTNPAAHLAFLLIQGNSATVVIRLFDAIAAFVPVTEQIQNYMRLSDGWSRVGFLMVDPIQNEFRHTNWLEECGRIAQAIIGVSADGLSKP